MIRMTLLLLCLMLFGAAAGRYKAENAVEATRAEIRMLEQTRRSVEAEIQLLRAEVAFLESPERLAAIADSATSLKPLSGAQLLTADDFRLAFAIRPAGADAPVAPVAPSALAIASVETLD